MDHDITRYLNDHLASSSSALLLIQKLADGHDSPEAQQFFLHLLKKVEAERALLEDLLERIKQSPSTLLKMAGGIAARVANLKLMWEEIEPGKLGLFEALELLTVGVQGKSLLWGALLEISAWFPEWNGIDFADLERQAIQQRDEIELWRIKAAVVVLVDAERRIGKSLQTELV